MLDSEAQRHEMEQRLLANLKERLPAIEDLLLKVNNQWYLEDHIYRFYHQSFKVFFAQELTVEIVKTLQDLLQDRPLNSWFMEIVGEGTGKIFDIRHNRVWLKETRPIVEALFHAHHFLTMAVKYGKRLDECPDCLPTGWASFLYLYNLR